MEGSTPLAALRGLPVNGRVWFSEEKRPYRVRARNDRYLVCTKPFNIKHTTIYCIVDLQEQIRGPEDLVFGMGAETDDDCRWMLARLEGKDRNCVRGESNGHRETLPREVGEFTPPSQVSYRHRIPLRIDRVRAV